MSLEETLAKAMYTDAGFSDWDAPLPGMLECSWEAVRHGWRSHARAALAHLNIDPKAEKVDVGEAVRALRCVRAEYLDAELVRNALRALGSPVD